MRYPRLQRAVHQLGAASLFERRGSQRPAQRRVFLQLLVSLLPPVLQLRARRCQRCEDWRAGADCVGLSRELARTRCMPRALQNAHPHAGHACDSSRTARSQRCTTRVRASHQRRDEAPPHCAALARGAPAAPGAPGASPSIATLRAALFTRHRRHGPQAFVGRGPRGSQACCAIAMILYEARLAGIHYETVLFDTARIASFRCSPSRIP